MPVAGLAFAPDGAGLVSWGARRCLYWWDLATLRARRLPAETSTLLSAALSPDGRHLACAYANQIVLADLVDDHWGRLEWCAEGERFEVLFTPDGYTLTAAGREIRRWEVATRQRRPSWPGYEGHSCLTFSPDGRTLAIGHEVREPGRARWDPATGAAITLRDAADGTERGSLRIPAGGVARALAYSPDGRFLAAAGGMDLRVWDVDRGAVVFSHWAGDKAYAATGFTTDGRYLAAAHGDRLLRIWKVPSWRPVTALDWKIGPLTALAFAPDGMLAACGSRRGRIALWDVDW
jgi:WD40 repeat protein